MIVNNLHQYLKIAVDKTDSLNSANFLTEELDLYLSDAQEEYIEQQAYGNNNKREFVEETQQKVKALQSITENANITTFLSNTNNKPNGAFVQLPSDYRHALSEEITISYRDCNNVVITTRIPVFALRHDEYNNAIVSPFAKPNLNKAYRLPYGRINTNEYFEIIIAPSQTLVTYHLRYLKNPRKIDKAQILSPLGLAGTAQGDMTDESYREIIRIAARNILGDIQSDRTQESIQKLKEIN